MGTVVVFKRFGILLTYSLGFVAFEDVLMEPRNCQMFSSVC
jgi:hypothetical protein